MNITDKIYWENNSRVKCSNLINPSKVITKSSTDKFPMDAITIRLYNMKNKEVSGTAYFYGKPETHKDWQGKPYQVAGSKLMVSINANGYVVFNGAIKDKSYSMEELTEAINYCKDILNKL